jgi:plasmid maintenance system antidote protein VapI
MSIGLDSLNLNGKQKSLARQNDIAIGCGYSSGMVPNFDWYLKEWLAALHKKQADIVRDLEWNKARVSLMISGKQQYTRDAVNELSDYLHIRPFELLMHPDDAMRLRRLKDDAIRIAHDAETSGYTEKDKLVSAN